MTDIHFVLGASDPEMRLISALLNEHEISYEWASLNGRPVNPKTAYQLKDVYAPQGAEVVAVECDGQAVRIDHFCDHHKEGDPGYAKGPDQYWEGSSIGQVVNFLEMNGYDIDITKEMKLTAAGDHCPVHAYMGLCPDIDPDELMDFRLKSRAEYTKRSYEELLTATMETMNVLKGLAKKPYADGFLVDIKDFTDLQEVPEASLRLCCPVEYLIADGREGAMKVGVLNGTPAMLEQWMGEAQDKYEKVYGNPSRGYAGAYLKEQDVSDDHRIAIAAATVKFSSDRFVARDIERSLDVLMKVSDNRVRTIGFTEVESALRENNVLKNKEDALATLSSSFDELDSNTARQNASVLR